MTAAEARGLVPPATDNPGLRSSRRSPGPYATACHDCQELFFSMAAETRHLEATGHHRYELVLE
jgi:hypothetical protein